MNFMVVKDGVWRLVMNRRRIFKIALLGMEWLENGLEGLVAERKSSALHLICCRRAQPQCPSSATGFVRVDEAHVDHHRMRIDLSRAQAVLE